jgi:hypothetical protein
MFQTPWWEGSTLAYFALVADSQSGKPLFNRTITLKDTWVKIEKKGN